MTIHCPNCGYSGKPKIKSRGSCFVLMLLLLLAIVPGVIYLLYMATGRNTTCPKCSYKYVIRG